MRQLKKAYLEITNVCNLRCDFCPGTRREPGFLPLEDFQTLAAKLRPHTEYLYLHLMGEPLLHPQLEEILDRAEGLGFKVMVTTNGTLLRERGALLRASPVVEKVSIKPRTNMALANTFFITTISFYFSSGPADLLDQILHKPFFILLGRCCGPSKVISGTNGAVNLQES